MPKVPRGKGCRADVIDGAMKVMRIATGKDQEEREARGAAPKALGPLRRRSRRKRPKTII